MAQTYLETESHCKFEWKEHTGGEDDLSQSPAIRALEGSNVIEAAGSAPATAATIFTIWSKHA